jgi:predicted nucleic acid-binding protein
VIVLDASVLIAHFDTEDLHHDAATTLLADRADDKFVASPVTVAEVLVGPARAGAAERVAFAVRHLGVTVLPLTEDSPVQLALIRAATGLKLPDCCVLLAAEQTGAAVATFDAKLAAAARERGLTAG